MALRRIIEGVKEKNLLAITAFIDFKNAFDTIHRGKLMRILKAYGIPDHMFWAVEEMLTDAKEKVIDPQMVRQSYSTFWLGCCKATHLLHTSSSLLLTTLFRALNGKEDELDFHLYKRKSRRIGPECITDPDFANDIALTSENLNQAQTMLERENI